MQLDSQINPRTYCALRVLVCVTRLHTPYTAREQGVQIHAEKVIYRIMDSIRVSVQQFALSCTFPSVNPRMCPRGLDFCQQPRAPLCFRF